MAYCVFIQREAIKNKLVFVLHLILPHQFIFVTYIFFKPDEKRHLMMIVCSEMYSMVCWNIFNL